MGHYQSGAESGIVTPLSTQYLSHLGGRGREVLIQTKESAHPDTIFLLGAQVQAMGTPPDQNIQS